MRVKSHIVKAVEETDYKAQYDTEVKKILSDPQILAWILKYTVKEFAKYTKVYSIWICMNAPLNSEYTITGYHMQREEIYGHMASTANQRYDLMELVMVCLGRFEHKEKGTKLHQLLSTVLSGNLTPQEKIEVMKNEYDIVTTVDLEGGLAKMCNLSDYIEEKGIQRGVQIGIGQGIEQGIEQGLEALVKSLSVFIQGEEALYQAVIKNEVYQNFSREEVLKYINN